MEYKIKKFKSGIGKNLYKIVDSNGRRKEVGGIIAYRKKSRAKEDLIKLRKKR